MYVQKGIQRIEVVVKREGGGGAKGNKEVEDEEVKDATTTGSGETSMPMSRKKRLLKVNITHAISTARQVGNLTANYFIGGMGDKYGDQALQDRIGRSFERVEDPLNVATSVVMGGVFGAEAGPIGAVMGAIFGLATAGTSMIFKYANRQREFDVKIYKEQNAIEYKRARADINLVTGRLR